ncbi:MAG: hypothetical protein ABGX00_00815 [Allomuricauda sp.]|uniref:hypothetical protein n=1 Tax=Sinomicrobium oceani TaxID=1150368 RepID=UPI00227C776C|nr:hypothetical protein [Sinomicrobium oceani]|tara:strand:+ start:1448 stop:1774 length:327 start_codon:yes stop_codon:yes gene_type:complete
METVRIIHKGQKMEVLKKTIEMNFNVSEHYEHTACKVGEGGQRGYETLEEFTELLKQGKIDAYDFDPKLGRKYYIGNFGEDYEGLQKVIEFCKSHGISIETHEREYRP